MKKYLVFLLMLSAPVFLVFAGAQKESGAKIKMELYNQKEQLPLFYEDLVKKFEERNPGVEIEVISPPDSETALFARVSTGNIPDIIQLWPAEPPYQDMMEEGYLFDLTGQPFLRRAMGEYLEMCNYKGKSYAMPTTISFYGLWYNVDIFKKYNLKPPATFDELLVVCETLKKNGVQPFEFKDKNPAQEFERLIGITNNNISKVIERIARGETSFTREPEARTLAEAMLAMRKFGQTDTLGTDESQARTDFFNQRAAMYTSGTWLMTDIKNFPNVHVELIPHPTPTRGYPTKMPINIDVAYSLRSGMGKAKTDAGLNFIDFITSPEIAQLFADFEGGPCIVAGVVQNTPELKVVMEQIAKKNTFMTPLNYWKPGLRPSWVPAVQNMLMTGDVAAFATASDRVIRTVYASN